MPFLKVGLFVCFCSCFFDGFQISGSCDGKAVSSFYPPLLCCICVHFWIFRYASEVAEQVSSRAVEGMGGMGFIKSSVAEKFFRDSKIGKIYEGTSNICLQVIFVFLSFCSNQVFDNFCADHRKSNCQLKRIVSKKNLSIYHF